MRLVQFEVLPQLVIHQILNRQEIVLITPENTARQYFAVDRNSNLDIVVDIPEERGRHIVVLPRSRVRCCGNEVHTGRILGHLRMHYPDLPANTIVVVTQASWLRFRVRATNIVICPECHMRTAMQNARSTHHSNKNSCLDSRQSIDRVTRLRGFLTEVRELEYDGAQEAIDILDEFVQHNYEIPDNPQDQENNQEDPQEDANNPQEENPE